MANDEDRGQQADPKDVLAQVQQHIGKDGAWQPLLGKLTAGYVAVTLAILAVELTYGLPIITVANVGIAGGLIVFLWGSVEAWISSGKPTVIFYACPNRMCARPERFIRIYWSELPKYRRERACQRCGERLLKRCQTGRHLIRVAPDSTELVPGEDAVCSRCSPSLPAQNRRFLPSRNERLVWLRPPVIAPWRERYSFVRNNMQ